jgi:hypothetical protein
VLIDNLRLDQWRVLEPDRERVLQGGGAGMFLRILPTATQYARNALFAGDDAGDIEKRSPGKWISEDDEAARTRTRRSSCSRTCSASAST